MEKRNTGKYYKYAFSEIVLVVIGILIALSINNWNEARKNKLLENDILKEIRYALKGDLDDAEHNLNAHRKKLISQNIIIDWFENDQSFADSLSIHFEKIQFGTYFSYYEGPYKTLNQQGMRIIKNDSLRNQIFKLYDQKYEFYNLMNRQYSQMLSKCKDLNPIYFNESSMNENKMKPINAHELKLDNRYLYTLKTSRNFNTFLITNLIPSIILDIKETNKMVNRELMPVNQ